MRTTFSFSPTSPKRRKTDEVRRPLKGNTRDLGGSRAAGITQLKAICIQNFAFLSFRIVCRKRKHDAKYNSLNTRRKRTAKIVDFETEIGKSAVSERPNGQQLGSKPARNFDACTGQQLREEFTAELDRFSSCLTGQRKKPRTAGASQARHGYLRDPPARAAWSPAERF